MADIAIFYRDRDSDYFSELLIAVNLVLSLLPSPFTTAMMASEMPAAINPYSIAVAPDSSARNALIIFVIIIAFSVGNPHDANGNYN
jgi:hypothetical protein